MCGPWELRHLWYFTFGHNWGIKAANRSDTCPSWGKQNQLACSLGSVWRSRTPPIQQQIQGVRKTPKFRLSWWFAPTCPMEAPELVSNNPSLEVDRAGGWRFPFLGGLGLPLGGPCVYIFVVTAGGAISLDWATLGKGRNLIHFCSPHF